MTGPDITRQPRKEDSGVPAVIYAAKSTEDKHGSIPTQIEDACVLADRERWDVVGEFCDEGFSAFSGNRGPGLESAKALAIETAREQGRCVLVAQDADRLARGAGDEPGAADHLGEVYFAMKRRRVELWTVRSGRLDLLRAAVEGERSHDETQRKAQATRAGLKRRKERGEPVGAIPLGYRVDVAMEDGRPVTRREVDPAGAALVQRIMAAVEAGNTPGQVQRDLNRELLRTARGKPWSARAVRSVVLNSSYAGRSGYPALIEPDRWHSIVSGLTRMDPASVQRRKGGRRPLDERYLLRGIAFCGECGGALRVRTHARGRVYICKNVREATGLCEYGSPIPAEVAEANVVAHLDHIVGEDLSVWLSAKAAEHRSEQEVFLTAAERHRVRLDALRREREKMAAFYRRTVSENAGLASTALGQLAAVEAELTAQERVLADTEARAEEWAAAPALDAALDYYNGLVELIRGRVRQASGADEVRAALQDAPGRSLDDRQQPSLSSTHPPKERWRGALVDEQRHAGRPPGSGGRLARCGASGRTKR